MAHFGGPWDHFGTILVIKWDTDALKGTLEGPRMDFGLFLMDFGSPFGHHFESLFDTFCHLKRPNGYLDCRHDFIDFWKGVFADS